MSFVAQWRAIASWLPEGWGDCRLRLTPARPAEAARIARLLGPASPGRAREEVLLQVAPGQAAATERLLARLDAEGIEGALELASTDEAAPESTDEVLVQAGLADGWDELASRLPEDWTDLLCLVELQSSDDLERAALALAPVNPSRHGSTLAFRFRVAHRFGYGAAPQMARRCLSRLDEQGIPGTLRLLESFADTHPHLTQGPTFKVEGRAV